LITVKSVGEVGPLPMIDATIQNGPASRAARGAIWDIRVTAAHCL